MANKFTVVLDAPLTNAQKNAINKDIQAVVAKHAASLDFKAPWGRKKIPLEWLGIWLKRFNSEGELKRAVTFAKFKVNPKVKTEMK